MIHGLIKPIFGTPLNRSHWAAQGLVAHYAFNEGSGDLVHDSCGMNDGKMIGMAPFSPTSGWVPGPHGGALAFDGSDDSVSVADSVSLSSIENGGTYIFQIVSRIDFRRDTYAGFIDTKPGFVGAIQCYVHVNNNLQCTLGGETVVQWSFDSNWAGQVHCIAGTWNKQVKPTITLYIDGVQKGQGIATQTVAVDILNIGNFNSSNTFPGLISSLSIYNRALSAEEIAYLYAFPWCMYDSGMSAWEYYQQKNAGLFTFHG